MFAASQRKEDRKQRNEVTSLGPPPPPPTAFALNKPPAPWHTGASLSLLCIAGKHQHECYLCLCLMGGIAPSLPPPLYPPPLLRARASHRLRQG